MNDNMIECKNVAYKYHSEDYAKIELAVRWSEYRMLKKVNF